MILTAICSTLRTGDVWRAVNLFKIVTLKHLKEKQLDKAIEQDTRFLKTGLVRCLTPTEYASTLQNMPFAGTLLRVRFGLH